MAGDANKIRVGLMGFGRIGRQFFHQAAQSDDIDIVAISDIGKPDILTYLLHSEGHRYREYQLRDKHLHTSRFASRMLQSDFPREVPWDVFDVDLVVDVTRKFGTLEHMQAHLDNGARRVLISSFPEEDCDRVVVPGINDDEISAADRRVAVGSATAAATLLILKALRARYTLEQVSFTSVHSYTSDQPVQDYAGVDYRRSRSAAENIIPNTAPALAWLPRLMPELAGHCSGFALNVPVQRGSLLDLDLVLGENGVALEDINDTLREACGKQSSLLEYTEEPIVSSDVIGNTHSALLDLKGTLRAGDSLLKVLAWYDTSGHAARLLDVVRLYGKEG